MANADYVYSIKLASVGAVLCIADLNEGGMTVTNDIENVIEEICQIEQINPVEHHIVYRNSKGNWDGYSYSTKQFIELRAKTYGDAITKLQSQVS